MKRIGLQIWIIIFCVSCIESFSQTTNIDSLETLLRRHKKEDIVRVNLLNRLAAEYYDLDNEKLLKYANEADKLAEEKEYLRGKAESLRLIGKYHYSKSDYIVARDFLQNSLEINKKFDNKKSMAQCWNYLGLISWKLGDNQQAKEYYDKALLSAQQSGDIKTISQCYHSLGIHYIITSEYSTAIEYFEKSIEFKKKVNDKKGEAGTLHNIGYVHMMQGNHDDAINYFEKAIRTYESIGDSPSIAGCFINLGIIYQEKGLYSISIEHYRKALKLYVESGDKEGQSMCLNNIGLIYRIQDEHTEALQYIQESKQIKEEIGDKRGLSSCLMNVGYINNDLGNYKTAKENFQKSLDILEELDDKRGISTCLVGIGRLYDIQDSLSTSLRYYNEALSLKEEIGDKVGICEINLRIGHIYLRKQNINVALKKTLLSLNIAQELGLQSNLMNSYKQLSEIYFALGKNKEAYKNHVLFKQYSDSIFNEANLKKLTRVESEYEFEREKEQIKQEQERKAALQAKETEKQIILRNSFIAGFVLMLFLVTAILYNFIQKRKANRLLWEQNEQIEERNEELEQQKEEIQVTLENLKRTQDQLIESEKMAAIGSLVAGVAHEINTPVGIGVTAITQLQEETKKMAGLYESDSLNRKVFKEFLQSTHDNAHLIQKNLERTAELIQSFKQVSVDQASEKQRVFNLKDYLEDIIRSLYPEFKNKKLEFKVDCNGSLELNSYPGAIAQIFTNLIMNSIAHGLEDISEGIIEIKAHHENEILHIEYRDNGKGINPEDLDHIFNPFYTSGKKGGTGLGLNIVYNIVKQKFKGAITCYSEEGNGASFRMKLYTA